MSDSVFLKIEFALWVVFSLALPIVIYAYLLRKKAISRMLVLVFGASLIGISAITVFLLQVLTEMAKVSPSLADDRLFASELALALYVLPVVFIGIGVNTISHVLIKHLESAEEKHDTSESDIAEKAK